MSQTSNNKRVFWRNFQNWKDYLDSFYKKLNRIKKYQVFEARKDIEMDYIRPHTFNLGEEGTTPKLLKNKFVKVKDNVMYHLWQKEK